MESATRVVEHLGAYLEDWVVGDEFVTPGRTIHDADLRWYERWVGKPQDESMCPAHLMLAAMFLIQRMGKIEGTGVANLGSRWRFLKPVVPGDTIWVRLSCVGARPSDKTDYYGPVSFTIAVENQRGET